MEENGIFQNVERSRVLGKAIKVYERVIYPVIQVSILKNNEKEIKGLKMVPIAFIVDENSEKYVISLTHEEIDVDDIMESINEIQCF